MPSALVIQPSKFPARPNSGVAELIVTGYELAAGLGAPPPLITARLVAVVSGPTTFTRMPMRPV